MIALKPDIMQVVCLVVKYQANPKQSRDQVLKRICRYLNETLNGLWYKKDDGFTLRAYTDVDWVRWVDDKRSTSCEFF